VVNVNPDDEIPLPVLLNPWKHHAGALRQRIAACANDNDLNQIARQSVVIGTDLMDLYVGNLTPSAIAEQVLKVLSNEYLLAFDAYRNWLTATGGYRSLPLDDQSLWVLRLGAQPGRYVHIHPGRRSPHTRRVRANMLKTAVIVLAHVQVHGGDPYDVRLINEVRQRLGLSPVPAVAGDEGLGCLISVLRQ
jgi:hypothetical protein